MMNGDVWVFGGSRTVDGKIAFYNDLHVLAAGTSEWVRVEVDGKEIPRARHRCSLIAFRGMIVLFGGNGEGHEYYGDVVVFDISKGSWRMAVADVGVSETRGPEVRITEPRGVARALHSATVVGSRMFVFGGVIGDRESDVLDELLELDLRAWTWISRRRLFARYLHAGVALDGRLWVVGGRNAADQLVSAGEVVSIPLDNWADDPTKVYSHGEMADAPSVPVIRCSVLAVPDVSRSDGRFAEKVLLVGRRDSLSDYANVIYIYDPLLRSWAAALAADSPGHPRGRSHKTINIPDLVDVFQDGLWSHASVRDNKLTLLGRRLNEDSYPMTKTQAHPLMHSFCAMLTIDLEYLGVISPRNPAAPCALTSASSSIERRVSQLQFDLGFVFDKVCSFFIFPF